ncbi:CDGSH iron-sulfur domain-containing protein [candidate division KSB1 bacterium]|nr:CDGSH iron-sulfur domain-containing protein [candidate division KSB1 bacterium]
MCDGNDNPLKPQIEFTKTSALKAKHIPKIVDAEGNVIPSKPTVLLCRCGASKKKPYCDGTHSKIDFKGEKSDERKPDRVTQYKGKEITILDNRAVCSRDGSCYRMSPDVFIPSKFKWIKPNDAPREEVVNTIRHCPSGSLSYLEGEERQDEWGSEPMIKIAKNGPYEVKGHIELHDDMDSKSESSEHYTLCRCGGSKNMPFCDGSHISNGFTDE